VGVVGINWWSYRPVSREPLTDFAALCPLTVLLPLVHRPTCEVVHRQQCLRYARCPISSTGAFAWYSPGSAIITACQDEGGQPC